MWNSSYSSCLGHTTRPSDPSFANIVVRTFVSPWVLPWHWKPNSAPRLGSMLRTSPLQGRGWWPLGMVWLVMSFLIVSSFKIYFFSSLGHTTGKSRYVSFKWTAWYVSISVATLWRVLVEGTSLLSNAATDKASLKRVCAGLVNFDHEAVNARVFCFNVSFL
jgi:hypothetical protein